MYIAIYGCFILSKFLGMPASPTSASNWLTRLRWKEIFSSIPERSIAKKFRAVFKKYWFLWSYVMKPTGHISLLGVFSHLGSLYEGQSHKLARPIGWLCIYERKYSPLTGDEVLLNNFEPFLRNSTSNIGMSCKLIDVYRHIRLFPFIEVSRNASLTN